MAGVRKVDRPNPPKFLATDQTKLMWGHFTNSPSQPVVGNTPVHATVAMICEFDFVVAGEVLVYQDTHRNWLLGSVTLKAVMDKARSVVWATALGKNTPQQNTELLKHERVHVELGERHARSVFQQVQKLSVTAPDMVTACQKLIQEADRIRKAHWQKYADKNVEYDRDTAHGTKGAEQTKWNNLYLSAKNTNATM